MEWTVVTVLISLVGFGAVVIKPLINLTKTITQLTTVVDRLQKDVSGLSTKNRSTHERMFEQLGEHDGKLNNHEVRICYLERDSA